MPPARRLCTALASALLAMAALVSLPGAQRAQAADREAPGGYPEGRLLERPAEAMAAEGRRAQLHRRLEQRRQMVRAEAHARMPNTMYASTPSSPGAIPSWHPVLVGPEYRRRWPPDLLRPRRCPRGRPSGARTSSPCSHRPPTRSGVRALRGSSTIPRKSGEVRIDAFDDQGDQHGPVTLHIRCGQDRSLQLRRP